MLKSENIIARYPLLILFLLFCIAELIINPVGNFPLNDDWWYAYLYETVFVNNTTSDLKWVSTSLMGQLIVTKPFALFFGSSYSALRFFTLLLSFLTIVFTYHLAKKHLRLSNNTVLFVCMLLMFNPLFLSLSNSYMTDVPFIFFLLGAIYFYLGYKAANSLINLVLSCLFFCLAILTRQVALAFLLAIVINQLFIEKKLKYTTLLLVALPVLILFAFEQWLHEASNNNGYNFIFSSGIKSPLNEAFFTFLKRWVHYLSISGLMLAPLLVPYIIKQIQSNIHRSFVFWMSLVVMIPIIISLRNFPIGNYLYNAGIGPDTLYDVYILRTNTAINESFILILVLKLVAGIGSFALLLILFQSLQIQLKNIRLQENSEIRSSATYFIISMFLYYLFLCFTNGVFDRYIMVFAIFAMLLIIQTHKEYCQLTKFSGLILLLMILFSVAGTKDYLQLNRSKWEAVNFLKNKLNVNDNQINAGYEHAGSTMPQTTLWFDKWKNIKPAPYLISKGNVKGYSIFSHFVYQRFIPFKNDTVFILNINQ